VQASCPIVVTATSTGLVARRSDAPARALRMASIDILAVRLVRSAA
jgi:hypothetical protein